jgi:nucleolar protein 9
VTCVTPRHLMPRENRKRGKKHKVGQAEQATYDIDDSTRGPFHLEDDEPRNSSPTGPLFGLLDPDVKAYFRTVNDQLRDWQEEGVSANIEADVDPNEGV